MHLDLFSCTKYCLSLTLHSKLWSSLRCIPIDSKVIVLNSNFMMQKVQHLHCHKELLLFTSFQ